MSTAEKERKRAAKVPVGWESVTVKDIADSIQYGHTASAVDLKGGPRFLRITDIQDGSVDWESVPSCILADDQFAKYKLQPGDLVFARTGATTGKSFLIRKCPEAIFASYLIRVRVRPEVDERYLAFFFQSADYWRQVESGKRGIGQPNVNGTILGQIQFLLPPRKEQRRIVEKIEELYSELDKGIENLKQARAQLAVYRQALLKHAFEGKLTADWRATHADQFESADQLLVRIHAERDEAFEFETAQWSDSVNSRDGSSEEKLPPKPRKLIPETRTARPSASSDIPTSWNIFHLDEILLSIGQGWSPKCDEVPAGEGEWGVIRTTAIQRVRFLPKENKRLPSDLKPRRWLQIQKNDVLITRAGPRSRVGIVCRVARSDDNLILCDKAYRLRFPATVVSPGFMELMLNSTDVANRIEKLKTGINDSGVNITQSAFLELTFQIPALGEQLEIQRILESLFSVLETMEKDIDANLQKAEALRQSVLKKAFAGELVPQDPADEPAAVLLARIRSESSPAVPAAPAAPARKQAFRAKASCLAA